LLACVSSWRRLGTSRTLPGAGSARSMTDCLADEDFKSGKVRARAPLVMGRASAATAPEQGRATEHRPGGTGQGV
jgi:hypothetical protein